MAVIMSKQIVLPVMGKLLSDYAIGESVFLNVNGVLKEFLVVNQGIPSNSSAYGSSCNNTWLMAKTPYTTMTFDSSTAVYANSAIHTYVNQTFFALLDTEVQAAIIEASIPYVKSGVNPNFTIGTLSAKVFIPSGTEVGLSYGPVVGAKLSYFATNGYNSIGSAYWTRSALNTSVNEAIHINSPTGYGAGKVSSLEMGVLPMLIMPFNTLFDDETNTFKGVV